jgi:hypothetical protein
MKSHSETLRWETFSYSAPLGSLPAVSRPIWQQRNFILTTDITKGDHKVFHPHLYSILHSSMRKGKTTTTGPGGSFVGGVVGIINEGAVTTAALPYDMRLATWNKTVSRFYDKVRGELDLSTDFAEISKTRAMIRKTVATISSLTKLTRALKHMDTKSAANAWLEWKYGWSPIMMSISGTIQEIRRLPPVRIRVAARSREEYKSSRNSPMGVIEECYTIAQSRCEILGEFKAPQNAIDHMSSYTSLNLVSIAWELTPLSFVVDWFVDVGGFLRDYESCLLLQHRWLRGYTTDTSKVYTTTLTDGAYTNAGYTTRYDQVRGWVISSFKERKVLSSPPVPRLPRFKVDLGWKQVVTSAALLRQRASSVKF